jgi:hypothetical protein
MIRTLKRYNGITLSLHGETFVIASGRNKIRTNSPVIAIQYYNNFLLGR